MSYLAYGKCVNDVTLTKSCITLIHCYELTFKYY
jgi:hypothetical protein